MKSKGFTLLELLVVLFIAGIISLLCVPWIGSQVSYYRFHNAVGGFKSSVNLAKSRPMGQTGGPSGTIFVDRVASSNVDVILTVGKDPYNPEKPKEHTLDKNKSYFVTLTGLNPQNAKKDFPWCINDRMYECNAPDKKTLKCKSGGLNVGLDPNPMPLSDNGVARIATAVQVTAWQTGQTVDPVTKETMSQGEYFRIKDRGSIIEYQYNKNNMKVVFVETDDKGNKKETDCGSRPCNVIFDHCGLTRDSTAYEITFQEMKTRSSITEKILPSGANQ